MLMFFIDQSHFQEESWLCRPIVPSYCKAVTILLTLMIFIFQPIIVQLALSHGHFLVRFFYFSHCKAQLPIFPLLPVDLISPSWSLKGWSIIRVSQFVTYVKLMKISNLYLSRICWKSKNFQQIFLDFLKMCCHKVSLIKVSDTFRKFVHSGCWKVVIDW